MLQLKNFLGVTSYFQGKLDQLLGVALAKSVCRPVLRRFLHRQHLVHYQRGGRSPWMGCLCNDHTDLQLLVAHCVHKAQRRSKPQPLTVLSRHLFQMELPKTQKKPKR